MVPEWYPTHNLRMPTSQLHGSVTPTDGAGAQVLPMNSGYPANCMGLRGKVRGARELALPRLGPGEDPMQVTLSDMKRLLWSVKDIH